MTINHQHTLRLAGIDAPEKKQAFGQRSKQSFSDLAYAKTVSAEISKVDKYGHSIAIIFVEGRDVNLEQVRAGMAWHYKEYKAEQSETQRFAYAVAENEARQAKLGLWIDDDPVRVPVRDLQNPALRKFPYLNQPFAAFPDADSRT